MTLTELQQEVYTVTNRPDLVARTLLAIRSATLKVHQSEYFYKDLHETGVSFDTSSFFQSITYRDILPLYRSLKYVRKTDILGSIGDFLEILTPEEVLDRDKIQKSDIIYGAGNLLQIKSSTAIQYIILGCYLNPDITVSGFSSWIALDHPYAIVYEAASAVFKAIGKTDEFSASMMEAKAQYAAVVASNILLNGF